MSIVNAFWNWVTLHVVFFSLGLSVWHRESWLYPICFWMRKCEICMVTHHWCTYNTPHKKKKHSSCVWAKLGFALIRTLNEWKCILPQDLEHYIHYFVVLLVFFCVCARACVVINSCKYITSRKKKPCLLSTILMLPPFRQWTIFSFFFGFDDHLAPSEINGWKATACDLSQLHCIPLHAGVKIFEWIGLSWSTGPLYVLLHKIFMPF